MPSLSEDDETTVASATSLRWPTLQDRSPTHRCRRRRCRTHLSQYPFLNSGNAIHP
jgi:hypothetical protein